MCIEGALDCLNLAAAVGGKRISFYGISMRKYVLRLSKFHEIQITPCNCNWWSSIKDNIALQYALVPVSTPLGIKGEQVQAQQSFSSIFQAYAGSSSSSIRDGCSLAFYAARPSWLEMPMEVIMA